MFCKQCGTKLAEGSSACKYDSGSDRDAPAKAESLIAQSHRTKVLNAGFAGAVVIQLVP